MKKAGLIILVLGVLIILLTGFNSETKEQVADTGNLEITAEKTIRANWSPMIGVAIMTVGGIIFILGGKER
ncbi:MAG: hypothetical protein JJU13_10915 [Balneolaceae bacterium]|nr:hypothetical protein [Balneolaceae bacterium]